MNRPQAGKKNAVVILNGISLKKKLFYHQYLPAISQLFNVEVQETLSKNDANGIHLSFAYNAFTLPGINEIWNSSISFPVCFVRSITSNQMFQTRRISLSGSNQIP